MRALVVLAAVGGIVSITAAQQAQLSNEVSTDGGLTWFTSADVLPASTFQVRVRCRVYGSGTILGLAGVTHQPTLSNWRADLGDTRLPFTFPGIDMTINIGAPTTETVYDGRPVMNLPQNTGRIVPFGTSIQNAASVNGLPTSFNDFGNTLRFAGHRAANGESFPAGGIQSQQAASNIAGTYFSTSRNVVIFKYAVTLSTSDTPRTLIADSPLNLVPGDFNGTSLTRWFASADGGQVLQIPLIASGIATINVVPAPGSVFLIAIAALPLTRRRRTTIT